MMNGWEPAQKQKCTLVPQQFSLGCAAWLEQVGAGSPGPVGAATAPYRLGS